MTVRFHSHASISVEGESSVLLTDPWFGGEVFHDSWRLLVPPDPDLVDFDRLRHIWISHEHPDHLHFPTLRDIRERTSHPVTVYYRRQEDQGVREAVAKLGFNVVELHPHEETPIEPDLSITIFPTRRDTAAVIRAGDRIVLNQNDCRLAGSEVDAIRRMFPRIDAWFFQFSLAGYYANSDDEEGLRRAREWHLRLIAEYGEAFRPATFIPFASFVGFTKMANAYLNAWMVSLDDVVQGLPHLPSQVLWNGDRVLWEGWEGRNGRNLARWRDVFAAPVDARPSLPVDEAELLREGELLASASVSRELAPFRPGEIHLQIAETGRAAAIDFRRGRFALLDRPDPGKLAGILPGEELLFFLKFPWGADTLHITACFQVTHAERWRRLMRFRHSLYAGTEKDEYRRRGIPWLAGRLARGVWHRARRVLPVVAGMASLAS
jgi:hypothetical protein